MFCSRWVCRSSVRARRFDSHSANGQPPTTSSGPGTRCERLLIVLRREKAPMPLLRQLEFTFRSTGILPVGPPGVLPGEFVIEPAGSPQRVRPAADKMPAGPTAETAALLQTARELLRALGAGRIAAELCVEWNSRLKTTAGRADYREKLISLNPRRL